MHRSRNLLTLMAVCAGLLLTVPAARAQVDFGPVYGTTERTQIRIAIPPFEVDPAGGAVENELFSRVIARDLVLSGFFGPPENPGFVDETHQLDLNRKTIHYAEWNRIGVSYLIRGQYTVNGENLEVEVKAYDTVAARYVFGRRYEGGWKVSMARQLAHRISNDIIERLTSEKGFADSQILFVRQLDPYGRTKQTCLMDADGHNIRPLTPIGELTATPAWGANGTEIYYTTYRDYNPDLAGLILRTGQTWWISRRGGFNLAPSWSPVQERIALTMTRDGNSEIYTLGRDGNNLTRLTSHRAIDASPTWSRDGSQLAYTSGRLGTGNPQIYIMDVRTRKERRLTYHTRYNDAATWSQVGPDRIAFTARVEGFFHIFTCAPDGSELKQLTFGNHNNEDPTWAPNGLTLAFTSDRTGRKQIFTMFADGQSVHQLTRGEPSQSPAWSPPRN